MVEYLGDIVVVVEVGDVAPGALLQACDAVLVGDDVHVRVEEEPHEWEAREYAHEIVDLTRSRPICSVAMPNSSSSVTCCSVVDMKGSEVMRVVAGTDSSFSEACCSILRLLSSSAVELVAISGLPFCGSCC